MYSKSITPHKLKARCQQFFVVRYPESLVEEIDGIDVMSIDSFAGGCLTRYVDGNFMSEHVHILQNCRDDLRKIAGKIPADAQPYFVELQWLIERVLDRCE